MGNRDLPWMPLFPADFLTGTQHWSFAERGAYILLLMYDWILDGIPDEDERLSKMIGMDFSEFNAVWPMIRNKFVSDMSGKLRNPRLSEHRDKAKRVMEMRKVGAFVTNQKRWANHVSKKQQHAERIAKRLADESHLHSHTHTQEELNPHGFALEYAISKPAKKAEAPEFKVFKAEMPGRDGDHRWRAALSAINARLKEGHTWQEVIDGAKRYKVYCDAKGITGTAYVMTSARFVGPEKSFELTWIPPQPRAVPRGPKSFEDWHNEAVRLSKGPEPWDDQPDGERQ